MWSFAKTGLFQNAKIRNRILFVNRLLSLLVSILKIKKETLRERLFPVLWIYLRLLDAQFLLYVFGQGILVNQDVYGLECYISIAGIPDTVISGCGVP